MIFRRRFHPKLLCFFIIILLLSNYLIIIGTSKADSLLIASVSKNNNSIHSNQSLSNPIVNSTNSLISNVVFSSYLGGFNTSNTYYGGYRSTVDSHNNNYIIGYTFNSEQLPILNAYNTTFRGFNDVYIAKLNSTGGLLLSMVFGGSGDDTGSDIAVDSFGNIYVTGSTDSTDFPTNNSYQVPTTGSNLDVFVAKFNATGSLIFSTCFGGSNYDFGINIAVDSSGYSYVSGTTYSPNFPTKKAYQSKFGGDYDAFLAKFDANGKMIFNTYLGGKYADSVSGMGIDNAGNIYIVGQTNANYQISTTTGSKKDILSPNDFPTKNAYQSSYNGWDDVFVAKFNVVGGLIFSTYFGGNGADQASGIAVDSAGNSYITGSTDSTNFPLVNAYNSVSNGIAFLAKFNTQGNLIFSTFIKVNYTSGIALDKADFCYIIGVPDPYTLWEPNFLAKFSPEGKMIFVDVIDTSLAYSITSIAIDSTGNSVITGFSKPGFLTTNNIYQGSMSGPYYIYIMKFKTSDQSNSNINRLIFIASIISFTFLAVIYTAVEYKQYTKFNNKNKEYRVSFRIYLKNNVSKYFKEKKEKK